MGRMVKSRQDGILSDGGLTGAGISKVFRYGWLSKEQARDQYIAYLKGSTFDEYSPYMSQIGGQGMIFSLFDKLLPFSPQRKLDSFYMLTALLSATALTLIVLWFYCEFGLCVAVFVALSMALSQWLTVFGRNLWWGIWAFYLPMIAIMYFLRYNRVPTNHHFIIFGILVFISVFVKCVINGYEYITTTLVMMTVPFIYYSFIDRLKVRQFLKGSLAAVFGSCLAIFLSLMILSIQIGIVNGDVKDGFRSIVRSLEKRTHGGNQESGTIDVVTRYFNGTFLNINRYLNTSNPFTSRSWLEIRYLYLIILFLILSILVFYRRGEKISAKQRQKAIALVFATWFSILAPLSWYVIFKAHSNNHEHMNYIVWQMPYTFFGFAVCGLVIKNVFTNFNNKQGVAIDR